MFAVKHFKEKLDIDLTDTDTDDERKSTNPTPTPLSTLTSTSPSKSSLEPKPKPKLRSTLNLDTRFFPKGLQAGSIISLQGNEGSGKTFFITYLLARFLHTYPEKYALLIDTACQFNIQNLLSVLCHIDEDLQKLFRDKPDTDPETLPKLRDYVKRLHLIRCFTPDELLMTIGLFDNDRSTIEEMLLENPELSFVAIDPLDAFCYCSALCDLPSGGLDLADLVKKCVENSKTPIICSFRPGNINAFLPQVSTVRNNPPIRDDFETDSDSDSDDNDNIGIEENKDSETRPNAQLELQQESLHEEMESNNQTENPGNNAAAATDSIQNLTRSKEKKTKKKYDQNNMFIFQDSFTHSLNLKIKSQPNPYTENPEAEDKDKLIIEAHLKSSWSRHNPNTALSGDGSNHLAKFSIFSGMVYLEDEVPAEVK